VAQGDTYTISGTNFTSDAEAIHNRNFTVAVADVSVDSTTQITVTDTPVPGAPVAVTVRTGEGTSERAGHDQRGTALGGGRDGPRHRARRRPYIQIRRGHPWRRSSQ
jgi:hypothetical protein